MNITQIQPGDLISVPIFPIFQHYGIVCDSNKAGEPVVVTVKSGKKTPILQTVQEFSEGKEISVCPSSCAISPYAITQKTMSRLNQPFHYNLFTNNCEHFCKEILGLPRKSDQVTRSICTIMGLVVVFWVLGKAKTA